MKIHALEIPEKRRDRLRWLEDQLVGVELPDLVAELRAVHGAIDSVALKQILADQLPNVLDSGLSELDDRRVQQLLRNPDSLFELQEKILLEGSEYWQQLARQPAIGFDTSLNIFSLSMEATSAYSINLDRPQPLTHKPLVTPHSKVSQPWYQHPLLISLATAAAVLIATNMYDRFQAANSAEQTQVASADGWGWDRPGALVSNVAPDVYMNKLADGAGDWFNKQPEDARQLATRIAQFRQGCSTLILADHSALAAADEEWLVGKCQAWAKKLDAHLAAVEAGEPFNEIKSATNETIKQLIGALRTRSSELSA